MAKRAAPKDKRYLEQRGKVWWCTVEVPPSLRDVLPKRLKRTLGTTDLAQAKLLRHAVVAELKQKIEEAKAAKAGKGTKSAIIAEGLKFRAMRNEASDRRPGPEEHSERDLADLIIDDVFVDMRGPPVSGTWPHVTYDKDDNAKADLFLRVALGKHTPTGEMVDQWLKESKVADRTQAEYRRAVARLVAWGGEALEGVDRKAAGRFVSFLGDPGPNWTGDPKSIGKYVSALSSYWRWLERKGYVDGNPWLNQAPAKTAEHRQEGETKERPFTDAEMVTLFKGITEQPLRDVMTIAALSGMRIDEICRLRVQDCTNDGFRVTKGKTPAGRRTVPIHSELKALVRRRTTNKEPDTYLIHELKEPTKGKERSSHLSQRFGRLIRRLEVAVLAKGKRRSLVNFHSFRRRFATEAERAGQPPHIISAVLGHEVGRGGMTLSLYSAGPDLKQLSACVEAVKLPQ